MTLKGVYEVLKKRFDDGNVDSPLDFKYVGQLQFVMSTIGSWPYKKFGRSTLAVILSIYNAILIFVGVILLVLGFMYMRVNRFKLSFFDLGHNILCWIFDLLYIQRLLTARTDKYQETIKDYLHAFNLFYFKGRSSYAAKVHEQIHVISGMFTIYVMWQMATGVSLFIFYPWFNNYNRGMFGENRPENITFEHSVYYYMPDAVYTTAKGYWMLFVFNIPTSYLTTIGLCVFDLLLCLIVFQIWGHLRILKYNLEHMPLPENGTMYSVEENDQIRLLLKENIVHHNFIIKFVDRCSDAFSEYLFAFYLCMQFITCILLLEVTSFTADSLAKYGPLTIGMHQQLIQVSILFEMLNTKSEQLIDAVYATPWEYMDSKNRRTMMIFLHRTQTPVSLKAAKVVPVGVNTMSAVLKTTFSYFMMLKTLAGER
ncbi:odorant receptor 43a-like [Leguminivora glycinivorella]|uniref:odorant receptor 43a-like n=1 Tax=Leguminivora glycinivorella TaxID=1035111 RepID=UPI0020101C4B|nr:odorant receptor 43a-like [Leguminivora glycinivorella]